MKTLIWGLTALLTALWTGAAALAHAFTGWLLGAIDAGALGEAGGAVASLPLPPLPAWLAPWIDTAWLGTLQTFGADLLRWLGAVLPGSDALMAWIGPLLWIGWGLGLLTLLALAGLLHWLVARTQPGTRPVQATA